jgi:hypothetical protein
MRHLAQQHHQSAVRGVGQRAAQQRERQDRRQLDQPQRPDEEDAVGELVHLERDGD